MCCSVCAITRIQFSRLLITLFIFAGPRKGPEISFIYLKAKLSDEHSDEISQLNDILSIYTTEVIKIQITLLKLLDDFILAKNFYKTAESSQLFISHVC